MKADPIGLYLHIPFCKRKCAYCDFCSFPQSLNYSKEEYIKALCNEIGQYKGRNISVNTVFFGGGTPSLLSARELSLIINTVSETFDLTSDAEITLEANPGTVSKASLGDYRELGINRLSFGLQSIHENELKRLGRIHNFNDFVSSFSAAREVGFENINVDIMFGIPNQTEASFAETVKTVSSFTPEHLSLYGLILEEGTPLYKSRNELILPDEDTECRMYYSAAEILAGLGYEHYEISNYAKDGFRCKHNLKYWKYGDYLGVGLSAHSYLFGERFNNTSDFQKYLSGKYIEHTEAESDSDREFEYAMLALRLKDGICERDYCERFNKSFIKEREEKLAALSALGLLNYSSERVALTEKGFYLSNTILSELI